ncbi:trypsin-like serine protease [Glutamicibacter soli]|uniref:Trypsin-like serine protease n=1 Tax=Glutamicibacter soli TaxID=453836 RepID=A0A6L9G6N6_9MICC|nr:S1 family peptidase [Glutamicibacter soli]NAZ17682.1 trypsin-like serine protease [Glutamicibacter soli]
MPKPNSKTAQRGFAAVAAAAAVVVGGGLVPAAAAPEVIEIPSESPSATAIDSAEQAEGLEEAVKRDLGKTLEQYNEESKVSEEAAEISERLNDEGIKASASVEGGQAEIKVSKADEAKAQHVVETGADKSATLTVEIGQMRNVGDVYEEVLENVKPAELTRLTAIMNTKSGLQIIADGPAAAERKATATSSKLAAIKSLTLEEFVAKAEGVKLVEGSGPAKTTAADDYFGAMGYLTDRSGQPAPTMRICSTGFNAWSPAGEDAIITAGHCAEDGQTKVVGIAEQTEPNVLEAIGVPVGEFGFSQFGGPNNSGIPSNDLEGITEDEWAEIVNNTEPGTDVAVIDDINSDLNLPALVSNWPAGGPREGTVKVTGVSKAVVGSTACSSGRTTGWGCSLIIGEGLFFVLGLNNDQRPVWGYAAENPGQSVLDQGDSGGPVMVGTRAVGINSADSPGPDGIEGNDDDLAFYTSLSDVQSKGYIDGYQIKFYVNTPMLTSVSDGAEVEPGAKLGGTVSEASSGTKVNVLVDGKIVETVAVDAEGEFSINAPQAEGAFSFTLEAVNGLNKSELVNGAVVVVAPEPTPTTTEPAVPTEPSRPAEPTEEPAEQASPPADQEPSASASDEPSKSTEAKEPKKDEPKKDEPLAETGAGSVPLIAAGGALALIGAAVLLLHRSARRHG